MIAIGSPAAERMPLIRSRKCGCAVRVLCDPRRRAVSGGLRPIKPFSQTKSSTLAWLRNDATAWAAIVPSAMNWKLRVRMLPSSKPCKSGYAFTDNRGHGVGKSEATLSCLSASPWGAWLTSKGRLPEAMRSSAPMPLSRPPEKSETQSTREMSTTRLRRLITELKGGVAPPARNSKCHSSELKNSRAASSSLLIIQNGANGIRFGDGGLALAREQPNRAHGPCFFPRLAMEDAVGARSHRSA
jgi:hypothetical protein